MSSGGCPVDRTKDKEQDRFRKIWQDSSLNDSTAEGWRHGLSLICPTSNMKRVEGGDGDTPTTSRLTFRLKAVE